MSTCADILLYVEDPGAANYALPLPDALRAQGLSCTVLAEGLARQILQRAGIRSKGWVPGESAFDILDRVKPLLVLVGTSENPDSMSLALIDEAKALGCVTVGFVDGIANARHRFRGRSDDSLAHAPALLIVPDELTAAEYVRLGFAAKDIVVAGHPHFDVVLEEGERLARAGRSHVRSCLMPDADISQRVIVFVSEISDGLGGSYHYRRSGEYTLQGRGGRDGRTEIVMEEFLDALASRREEVYLVLRLHPKDEAARYGELLDEWDLVSQGAPPLPLAFAADMVVGMSSMLLLEAGILGRPTLSILPRACEKEWLTAIQSGFIPAAVTSSEIANALYDFFSNRSTPLPVPAIPRGCSGRVVAAIRRLVDGREP